MRILAIESTAHTLGIAVVQSSAKYAKAVDKKNTRVLSNEIARYPAGREGFIPRKLADHHAKSYPRVLRKSLEVAKVSLGEVDFVAIVNGPGIGHCLHAGFVAAKSLSLLLRKPLVPVNHAIAHVEVGKWSCGCADPLIVYVSGGNTQIISKQKYEDGKNYYHVYGETLDVGIGNFLDVLGRELGTTPPNAIGLLKLAERGKNFVPLPYTVKGNNLAFAGLQSAVLREAGRKAHTLEDLVFSAREVAFSMLVEASERVLCHTANSELLLVGGVAQSRRLQEMYGLMCKPHGTRFCVVPPEYAGDQAAMAGIAAVKQILSKTIPRKNEPEQNLRIDSSALGW